MENETPEPEPMKGSKALLEVHNNIWMANPSTDEGNNMNTNAAAFQALFAKFVSGEIEPPRVVDIANVKRDNIVLEKYLRIGDLVVMHMDKESRDYRKDVPDGTIGIVFEFTRYKDYHARIHNWGEAPGVYMKNGVASVMWTDGTVSQPGAGSLRWLTENEKKTNERREDRAGSDEYDRAERLGDLPELPIWEMDIITVKPNVQSPWRSLRTLRVRKIDYHNLDRKRNDGSPMPIYDVTPLEEGHGSTTIDAADVQLIERGNLWKWFNDKRDEVKFVSIEDEISFHFAIGNEEQIKCEQTNGYHWPLRTILPALQAGAIDLVKRSGGMFGSSDSMSAHKLTDPDLSKRVREESIRGYSQDMHLRIVSDQWDDFTRHYVIRRAIEMSLPFINVKHSGKDYVDTAQLEMLGIPVIRFAPAEGMNESDYPKGAYIYFSPKSGAFDLPHESTHEINEEEMKRMRVFKRNRDDHFEVRVQSNTGWSEKNRDIVIAACKAFNVPFADRANVADDVMKASGIEHIVVTDDGEGMPITFDINGYVFFTHRGMKDLSFDVTVQGHNE